MKHTAKRLIPYAVNGVVHINKIFDPALKRLCSDQKLVPLIRRALKEIGENYELLIPYRVDDEELQLKRYIQLKLGTTVNLTELRKSHHNYYLKVYKYGSPAEVITKWGLNYTYGSFTDDEWILETLENMAIGGEIKKMGKNSKIYDAVRYQSKKRGITVKEYLAEYGYDYTGGR